MSSSVQQPTDVNVVADGMANPAPNPVRRSFTAEYRARVVAEYEAAPHGEKAAVLRREGLYQSQVREWRAERDARAAGLVPRRGSHRSSGKSSTSETDRLRTENARLARELTTTAAALEIMGKLQGLCAPRGARSYRRFSRWELEGRFLGLMAYPDAER